MQLSFLKQYGFTAQTDVGLKACLKLANAGDVRAISFIFTDCQPQAGQDFLAKQYAQQTISQGQLEFAKAISNYISGDVTSAEQGFRLAADDRIALAMWHLGNIEAERNSTSEAELWYRKASDLNHVPSMIRLVALLENRAELESVKDILTRASELGSVHANYRQGVAVAEEQTFAHALPRLRRVPQSIEEQTLEELSPEIYFDLGQRFDEMNMSSVAENYIESALLSIAYESPNALVQDVNMAILNGNCPWFEGSQDLLDSAVDINTITEHKVIWE
jgi:TPR repeat protein